MSNPNYLIHVTHVYSHGDKLVLTIDHALAIYFLRRHNTPYPWANEATDRVPIVWNRLPVRVKVAYLSFSSRNEDGSLQQSPTEFELVGSDDCSSWRSISRYQTKFSQLNQVLSWEVPLDERQMFSCIGIKVNEVSWGAHAAIHSLRMWKQQGPNSRLSKAMK